MAAPSEVSPLVHHVFFWLKHPQSQADLQRLLEGVETLRGIETIRQMYIGVPAATEKRDVIDDSYSVSLLQIFDDIAGEKYYQDHPLHQKFIQDCHALWEKVVVYDSATAQR
ncbi:MAG: hypothetical protein RLZZ200_1195 [Pseudomonadota bacterium]